ncbi:GDP-mannose pyrophosphatase NudK [Pedobacter sp. AW31-3R]|uniref:GDP-mannose pyrophosphatase NudK n=1 Tax=Pedobacter sp. AW31-3R TaxID=3445781 RepID=UPI003F9F3556
MQNSKVSIIKTEILSDHWYTLRKITYTCLNRAGVLETVSREAYDRGNGATILLYNLELNTVILTRQFRLPTFINGNENGMLIEACAGLLDNEHPEDCIRRETEEETGYKITALKKIFEAYMSPGSVTEILHFYIAEYTKTMQISDGGGLEEENENIEVLEIDMDRAFDMMGTGEIKDAKTIMLLQHMRINRKSL